MPLIPPRSSFLLLSSIQNINHTPPSFFFMYTGGSFVAPNTWEFRTIDRIWRRYYCANANPGPRALHSLTRVTYQGVDQVLLFGGLTSSADILPKIGASMTILDDVWLYNPNGVCDPCVHKSDCHCDTDCHVWRRVETTGIGPGPIAGHLTVPIDSRTVAVIGGCSDVHSMGQQPLFMVDGNNTLVFHCNTNSGDNNTEFSAYSSRPFAHLLRLEDDGTGTWAPLQLRGTVQPYPRWAHHGCARDAVATDGGGAKMEGYVRAGWGVDNAIGEYYANADYNDMWYMVITVDGDTLGNSTVEWTDITVPSVASYAKYEPTPFTNRGSASWVDGYMVVTGIEKADLHITGPKLKAWVYLEDGSAGAGNGRWSRVRPNKVITYSIYAGSFLYREISGHSMDVVGGEIVISGNFINSNSGSAVNLFVVTINADPQLDEDDLNSFLVVYTGRIINTEPEPRIGASMVTLGNVLWVYGGYGGHTWGTGLFYVSLTGPDAGEWRFLYNDNDEYGTTPGRRTFHSAVKLSDGNTFLIHGGVVGTSSVRVPREATGVYIWSQTLLSWEEMVCRGDEPHIYDHQGVLVDGGRAVLYFGGRLTGRVSQKMIVNRLDLVDKEWQQLTAANAGSASSSDMSWPANVASPTAVALVGSDSREYVYVIGGLLQESTELVDQNTLHRYDVAAGTWSVVPLVFRTTDIMPFPKDTTIYPRHRHCAQALSTRKFLLYGGQQTTDIKKSRILDDVWSFDSITEEWTLLSAYNPIEKKNTYHIMGSTSQGSSGPTIFNLVGASCSQFEGDLYVFGGLTENVYSNYLSRFRPACRLGYDSEGKSFSTTQCRPCPVGTYRTRNDTVCRGCPKHLSTYSERSISLSDCNICKPNTCNGHGTCTVLVSQVPTANCACDFGYTGAYCDNIWQLLVLGVVLGVVLLVTTYTILYRKLRKRLRMNKRYTELQTLLLEESRQEVKEMERAWQIDWEEVLLQQRIDAGYEGTVGEVWLAQFRDQEVAVKKLMRAWWQGDESVTSDFDQEIRLLRTLNHRNIVYFYGAGRDEQGCPFFVTEFVTRGSLMKVLADTATHLSWRRRLGFLEDAARGMQFIHGLDPPRIHRDLKTLNLLVSSNWTIKVADFGTAALVEQFSEHSDGGTANTHSGRARLDTTPLYAAPEIINGGTCTMASDVYSYAIVMWEVATRQEPFGDVRHRSEVLEMVARGSRPRVSEQLHADMPRGFNHLMVSAWAQDAGVRPSFLDIVPKICEIIEKTQSVNRTPVYQQAETRA